MRISCAVRFPLCFYLLFIYLNWKQRVSSETCTFFSYSLCSGSSFSITCFLLLCLNPRRHRMILSIFETFALKKPCTSDCSNEGFVRLIGLGPPVFTRNTLCPAVMSILWFGDHSYGVAWYLCVSCLFPAKLLWRPPNTWGCRVMMNQSLDLIDS